MSLTCLCSAHGSPGVTTTVLALAGVWPEGRRVLVVEADPSGGMLAARLGLSDTPGLVSLAAAARRGLTAQLVWRHAQQAADGVGVIVAPPAAGHALAALQDLAGPLAEWCAAQREVDVLVDSGRLLSGPVVLPLLRAADQVLLLARPTADQLRPAAARVQELRSFGVEPSLLMGDTLYGPDEVESAIGVSVAAVLPWDPHAAEVLAGVRSGRDVRRSPLVRSAASLVDRLAGTRPGENAGSSAEHRVEEEVVG